VASETIFAMEELGRIGKGHFCIVRLSLRISPRSCEDIPMAKKRGPICPE